MSIIDRFKGAWSALRTSNEDKYWKEVGTSSYTPYFSGRQRSYNRNSITSPVFNRIALDVSKVDIRHVVKDSETGNMRDIKSRLLDRITLEANIDQTGRSLIQDIVYSMMDEGVVAVVPIDTDKEPASGTQPGTYDILSMRTARIVQWYPKFVRVEVYDDNDGQVKQITLPKDTVAIIENPLYSVVNSPNSTLDRLSKKLAQLDWIDQDLSSGKMNLILQLPYIVKTEAKKEAAERRIQELEDQISKGRYGVAYTDGTERITQLNRSFDNNILKEVESLTNEFYNQIGLTGNVFNGTAGQSEMLIYYSRTIDPLADAILEEFNRKFITRTARSQGQMLVTYRDPFRLVPMDQAASIASTLITSRVVTPNEMRPKFGYAPATDPQADKLLNPNVDTVNNVGGAGTDVANTPKEDDTPDVGE